jgi:Rrf2 family iron-sulfur cluster assembly transcriptional regulator
MIRLSTKGRYGTRLMLNLARHHGLERETVILKRISEDERISIRYLEQIIIPLKINRLVKSIRGAGGGYTLARRPEDIKLGEILEALEGHCCLVECIDDGAGCDCVDTCPTYDIWKGASELLRSYFDGITLKDLLERAKKKERGFRSSRVPGRTPARRDPAPGPRALRPGRPCGGGSSGADRR